MKSILCQYAPQSSSVRFLFVFILSMLGEPLISSIFALAQPAERIPSIDPTHYQPSASPCYDERGLPQRCVPDFINAAFNLEVEATNTCGIMRPSRFCIQTGHMGVKKDCDVCDARVSAFAHPSQFLTDFNNPNNETWWQSETMAEGIQFPNTVNLTLNLGKTYDITYVRLKFVSPRPESFVIYKKTHANDDWVPWQYYSGSCRSTFKMPEKALILPTHEAIAQCTREFSDISPLTGGNIAFSTLEGRPSAENFEESEILQEWVTASSIKIVLVRMNTFGDEIFHDPRVHNSYFYAISDFAVGGRCKCNGHANQCVKSTGTVGAHQLVCDCQHHTTGIDCQECEPFYVDRPWKPATSTEANECLPCNCNNLSNRCFFDQKLYEETGSGGHCIDCAGNTLGPHCEQCIQNHWRRPGEHYCRPCQCSEIGSIDGQCDEQGQCKCKPGVTGQYCDQCSLGFYDFSSAGYGCKDCRCDIAGSLNNTPNCSPVNGSCICKTNVEGQRCQKCLPGYFQLAEINPYGCTPCFCFGHSSVCTPAEGYFAINITSKFSEDTELWAANTDVGAEDVQWAQLDRAIAVSQIDDYPVYLHAPAKFLGDQRLAYNQFMSFTLRIQQGNAAPSKKDVIIVGANKQELSVPITAQKNPLAGLAEQTYQFRLHSNAQWSPTLREIDFIGVLTNVTAIKIRGTFSKGDVGFLSKFKIQSASLTVPEDDGQSYSANWVENCKCPEGFVGQFCESCAHGYKRALKFGGPLSKCVKCECHGHSESCDAESGVCICRHNTAGEMCERCTRGWYGDALIGTAEDCNKCDCPNDTPCMLLGDGETLCTECPEGYTGRKCEICAEDFFGSPSLSKPCQKCDCNDNTDPNAIGKCDTTSGECRRCIYHTTGWNCEKCEQGYWGNALSEIKGDCKPCGCFPQGTMRTSSDYDMIECRQSDGQCQCHPNVVGKKCDSCALGFFNISSGNGCHACECDPLGSFDNGICDMVSGQCKCKLGVSGRRCELCAPQHFGFGSEGCKPCNCDPIGSETMECDVITGQCLCKANIEGRRCDQCSENRYNVNAGCPPCDDCYALIQHRKNEINGSLNKYHEQIDDIQKTPLPIDDAEFHSRITIAKENLGALHLKANKKLSGDDSKIRDKVQRIKGQLDEAERLTQSIQQQNFQQIDQNSLFVVEHIKTMSQEKDAIQKELESEINFVNNQGQLQIENAQQAANRHGEKSQELSDLAKEARRLAEHQEQRKAEILSIAEQITNLSITALNDVNDAVFGASSTSQQISNLMSKVREVQQRLKNTKSLIDEQTTETNWTYNEAARILSKVESVRLPNVVSNELQLEAQSAADEASKELQSVKDESSLNTALLIEAEQTLRETIEQMQNVIMKQGHIDRSFEEIERLNGRAKVAFDLSTKTWNEAKDTHELLSDFYSKVEQSKQEAMDELSQLPEVEKELKEAEGITIEAEDSMGDVKQDADHALQISIEARLKAENIAAESPTIEGVVEKTKLEAEEFYSLLGKISEEIDSLMGTTKDFENQALSDSEQSNDVLRRSILVESTAKGLQERIDVSEKKLTNAFDQLNSLENIDDSQLSELEQLIDEAERRYEKSESEKQIKERIRRVEMEAAAEKRQIDAITKELEHLRGVRDSLPTKCFNLVSLEQEGQRRRK